MNRYSMMYVVVQHNLAEFVVMKNLVLLLLVVVVVVIFLAALRWETQLKPRKKAICCSFCLPRREISKAKNKKHESTNNYSTIKGIMTATIKHRLKQVTSDYKQQHQR